MQMNRVLIIGFGNPLRGDDGVGPIVVSRLSRLHSGAECVTTMQLHPEHAELMRGRDVVIFVDASVDAVHVMVNPVDQESGENWQAGHSDTPAGLTALCRAMYPDPPERVYLLEIPARSLEFGEHLTARTRQDASEAETLIRNMIPELRSASPSSPPSDSR
jgi:hydrogenase maturation protease